MRQILFAGPAFTASCQISKAGKAVVQSSLIDTGCKTYTLIHPRIASTIVQVLGLKWEQFQSVGIAGFNNKEAGKVNRVFKADLILDNHRILTYFVECNTGRHDVIVGDKTLSDADVAIHPKERGFIWLDDSNYNVRRDMIIPLSATEKVVDPAHQADAERRDQLFEKRDLEVANVNVRPSTPGILPISTKARITADKKEKEKVKSRTLWSPRTEKVARYEALRKMND